ncbi:hypothetical protein D5086_024144 [Populus alba]|uniref:Uncharacterized protein n=1 Tax=Populus alba TaxID=43335 RepID=A0ACC4B5F1_POPAL
MVSFPKTTVQAAGYSFAAATRGDTLHGDCHGHLVSSNIVLVYKRVEGGDVRDEVIHAISVISKPCYHECFSVELYRSFLSVSIFYIPCANCVYLSLLKFDPLQTICCMHISGLLKLCHVLLKFCPDVLYL